MKNNKIKTFDENGLRRKWRFKKIIYYIIQGIEYFSWTSLLFIFLYYLIFHMKLIITNPAYATVTLAIATIALAIIAAISIAYQSFLEQKRNRIRYLEKAIEEIYNPLLSYFKENPDIHFEKGMMEGILTARKEIDKILFNKRFILEPPGGVVKNFNGYFQRYENENKMNYSGWAFAVEDDVIYWQTIGFTLYHYYEKHINQYRTYMNLGKIKLNSPKWEKVFYLDKIKDPKYILK